jgi:transcriptional regulator with XRE-family HTH domain
MIAERCMSELPGHKALSSLSAGALSEKVADKVWADCRKSDAYMINLERDIAKYMANAVKLRFYGSQHVTPEEVVSFIQEYYRIGREAEPAGEEAGAQASADMGGPREKGRFATYFSALRQKRKDELTLHEMSKRCSISKSMLEAFLKGDALPKRDTVFKLAYGLKLSQAQLVEMMDAIDADLDGKPGRKSYKISRSNPRDMLLFTELSNRLSIEDLNARLVGARMQALEQPLLPKALMV